MPDTMTLAMLRKLGLDPMASHEPAQAPYDPTIAAKKAKGIGPANVGDVYLPKEGGNSLLDVARSFMGGQERPPTMQAQDPMGIDAWMQGAESGHDRPFPIAFPMVTKFATPAERMASTEAYRQAAKQFGGNLETAMGEFATEYPRIAAHIQPDPSKAVFKGAPKGAMGVMRIPASGEYKGPMKFSVSNHGQQLAEQSMSNARGTVYHEGTHAAQFLGNKDMGQLYMNANKTGSYWENPFEINARVAGESRAPGNKLSTDKPETQVDIAKYLKKQADETLANNRLGPDKRITAHRTKDILYKRDARAAENKLAQAFSEIQDSTKTADAFERTANHPVFGELSEKDARELVGGGELPMSWYEKKFPSTEFPPRSTPKGQIDTALSKRGIPEELQQSLKDEQFKKATNKFTSGSDPYVSPMTEIAKKDVGNLAPPRKGKVTYNNDRGTTTIDYDNPLPNGALPTVAKDFKGNIIPFNEYTHPISLPWVEANHVNWMKRNRTIDVSPSETFNRR